MGLLNCWVCILAVALGILAWTGAALRAADVPGRRGSSCKVLKNTDFPGGVEVDNDRTDITASDAECCARCNLLYGCRYWIRSKSTGECWLKSSVEGEKKTNATNSGVWIAGKRKKDDPCGIIEGVDLYGGKIINNGKTDITKSDEHCCALCDETPGCKAWTRTVYETQGSKIGECWLRDSYCSTTDSMATNSGIKTEQEKCQKCRSDDIQWNIDYSGDDQVLNDGRNTLTETNQECCELCQKDPACKTWTRISRSDLYNRWGQCFLKGGNNTPVVRNMTHSGQKIGKGEKYYPRVTNSCSFILGTQFSNSDPERYLNDGANDITSSDSECCQKCDVRQDCNYWTRYTRSSRWNKEGECWLMESITEVVDRTATNSGAKRGTIKVPKIDN